MQCMKQAGLGHTRNLLFPLNQSFIFQFGVSTIFEEKKFVFKIPWNGKKIEEKICLPTPQPPRG